MNKIKQLIRKSFDKKIDGTGLAIFRIIYSLILLGEISQMMYFKSLIFDKIPFLETAEINFGIPIFLWFISVVFLLFGAFTRFFSILNYLLGLIIVGSIHSFEYHVFYAYMGINFLIIFMPVSQCLSLDRLFQKLKYSNTTFQYNPVKTVSQLYYFLPPFFGIALVYFDSVFFKLSSPLWMNGLGSWLPSSLPMATHVNNGWFLNQEWLVKIIGWATILFETIFMFVFFRKRWRMPLFAIGMILHLGILFEFPIPFFALTVCAIYLLIVPVSFWKRVFSYSNESSTLTFYYDAECPLCIRTKICIQHLDWFNKVKFKTVQFDSQDNLHLKDISRDSLLDNIYSVDNRGKVYSGIDTYIQVMKRIFYLYPISILLQIPGIYHFAKKCYNYIAVNRTTERCTEENCGYNPPNIPDDSKIKILQDLTLQDLKYNFLLYLLLGMAFIQFTFLYTTPVATIIKEKVGFNDTKIDRIITSSISFYQSNITRTFFGLTNHPVFMDQHFKGYNHIIAIVYLDKNKKEQWLPIIDKNGMPGTYIYGANWVNWTFRVNSAAINQKDLAKGVERYTAFWAHKNHIDLADAKFLIKVKKIDNPDRWQKDFLDNQIAKSWVSGGYVVWEGDGFVSHIEDIERL